MSDVSMQNNKVKVVDNGYKYFMVFLCMLTQAIPYGVAQLIQPLFVHPIINTFHFTLASYTLIFTFGAVVGAIVSPIVGKALEKVDFKLLYLIGIALSAGAYVIFGLSTQLPSFYLAGIICMVGSTFYSGQGVPWIINHWFPYKGRGTALGLAFCGGSIGDIFLQPLTQSILKLYMTSNIKNGSLTSMAPFFIFSIILLITGAIIACFIRVPRKNEALESFKELAKDQENAAQERKKAFQGWSSSEVLRMKWFWVFSIGFMIIGLGLASLNEDYAAFLDTKLNLIQVGIIGSILGAAGIIGNISGGYLFDKLGTAKAMTYAAIMLVFAILMMILISLAPNNSAINMYLGCGWAITSGLSVFSYMSGPAFMAKNLFGVKSQGVNLGYISLAYAIGFAIGAPLFGIIKKLTNFTIAWSFTGVLVVIGFVLLITASVRIMHLQK